MKDDVPSSSAAGAGAGGDDFDPRGSSSAFSASASASASTSASDRGRRRLSFDDDLDTSNFDRLYLVPYRWWRDLQSDGDGKVGVLYKVSLSLNDDKEEIALGLRKEEDCGRSGDSQEGFPGGGYALISESMWFPVLKRHNDYKGAMKDVSNASVAECQLQEVFTIKIRLSVSLEATSLVAKISLEDNLLSLFKRACSIFGPKSDPSHIWDFSGQTTQLFMTGGINTPNGFLGQPDEEFLLELRVYGFSDSEKGRDERICKMAEHSQIETLHDPYSVKVNEMSDYVSSYWALDDSSQSGSYQRGVDLLGLAGLQNLGNTCFMNSAIQCLAHTPKFVDYFLGDYRKDINHENPIGVQGQLALAFGDLLRRLWTPGKMTVVPKIFKQKLANFAPQFSGYNQHDSQELLSFLLDGLHEDLNRVKSKPYREVKDAEGRPDKELAEEYWQNHLARNDSVIVDLFQGQYQSTLVCTFCKMKSVTFDPFMYLSLPLPSTTMRTMILTVMSTNGINLPSSVSVTVPKCGRLKDLVEALSALCSLRNDEVLLVAEIYKNKIFRILDEPSDSLALIRDDDTLVAYRLSKDKEASPLVVFMHDQMEKPSNFVRDLANWNLFGIPLVSRSSDLSSGSDLRKQFLKLLNPFLMPSEDELNDFDDKKIVANEDSAMEDVLTLTNSDENTGSDIATKNGTHSSSDFQFYLKDSYRLTEIRMNEPLPVPGSRNRLDVHVYWSEKMIERYDTSILSLLPEVSNPPSCLMKPQESVSLYKCLEAYLTEEPLVSDDMWRCPRCKKPRQASKKLDLWRLPEIFVIHLKRFSYSRYIKEKLETYVDFPINDLDLSTCISRKDNQFSSRYVLYAISNHYGTLGGGHYTAFVDHGFGKWYVFDDDKVFPITEDRIITSAAYLLLYRRVS